MAINFPNTPASGEVHTEDSRSWIWDTVSWNPIRYTVPTSSTIRILRPLDYEPPNTDAALLDLRNNRPVLEFDPTTQWTAIWTDHLPLGTNLYSGVQVDVWWSTKTVTAGTVGWDVAFERNPVETLDMYSDDFGTAKTISATTVPATSGVMKQTSVSFSYAELPSGLGNGELYRLRLRRNVAVDTAAGRAGVHMIQIQTLN